MHLTLLFTYGVSIKDWHKSGLLEREILIYKELKKKYDLQIQFITFGDKSDKEFEESLDGITIIPVYEKIKRPKSRLIRFFKTFLMIWVYRNDLVKTNLVKTNQQWGSWLALLIKKVYSKPLILRSGYNNLNYIDSKIIKLISFISLKLSYKYSDQIHVSSESDKKSILSKFKVKDNKIIFRQNWIDTNSFTSHSKKRNDRILFVGRLSKEKNIPLLLDALKGTQLGLDIIGDGNEKNTITDVINNFNLDIKFLGNKSNNEMPTFYNKYSIFVLCSTREGNPKALLEAMSCEMAVIGTDVIGINEIIINNYNGILINSNPAELRSAMIKLHKNPTLQNELGSNARKTIIKNNAFDKILSIEYLNYKELHEKNKNSIS